MILTLTAGQKFRFNSKSQGVVSVSFTYADLDDVSNNPLSIAKTVTFEQVATNIDLTDTVLSGQKREIRSLTINNVGTIAVTFSLDAGTGATVFFAGGLDSGQSLVNDSTNAFSVLGSNSTKVYMGQSKVDDTIRALKIAVSTQNAMELGALAVPPTITFGADNATNSIPSATLYPVVDSRIRTTRFMEVSALVSGRNLYGVRETQSLSVGQGSSFAANVCTFLTEAPIIGIDVQAQPSTVMGITVDGQRINDVAVTATSAGNARKMTYLDWGATSLKLRKYSIQLGGNFAGIWVGNSYNLRATTDSSDIDMFMVGDSYGGDGYYGWRGLSFDQDLAHAVGIENYAHSYVGGTGYVNPNTSTPIAPFLPRLKWHVQNNRIPRVLLTAGGINDNGTFPDNQKLSAINEYYAWVKENLPNTLCISIAPWAPDAGEVGTQPHYIFNAIAIKNALVANNLPHIFLDTLTGSVSCSWSGTVFDGTVFNVSGSPVNNPAAVFTGSGTVSSDGSPGVDPTFGVGTGNTYNFIRTDGTHPTGGANSSVNGLTSGRAYLSKWVINGVRQALLTY